MSSSVIHGAGVMGLFCLSMILSTSCLTTRFTMPHDSGLSVQAVVLGDPRTVQRSHINGFEMVGPARIAMRAERLTHGRFSMEVTRRAASPLILNVRTTPYEDSVLHRYGMRITINGDSTTVESPDFRSVTATPLPLGKPFVVEIGNFGHAMYLRVGHTDCGLFRTTLPCTEWIMVTTTGNEHVMIGDPLFDTSI